LFVIQHTATTEIYSLSLHDALPILDRCREGGGRGCGAGRRPSKWLGSPGGGGLRGKSRGPAAYGEAVPGQGRGFRESVLARRRRSEEHTSELQSHLNLVCRPLLEKK